MPRGVGELGLILGVILGVILGLGAISACRSERPVYGLDDFSADPAPTGPLNGNVVVCDTGDDTLSVIDPATHRRRWQIPVGFIPVEREGPHDAVASPAGDVVYVTLSEAVAGSGGGPHGAHGTGTIPGYVLAIDARDGTLRGRVQVEPNPAEMAVSPDGSRLYVTHYDLNKWVRATTAGDITQGYSDLAVIDTRTMTVIKLVPLCPGAHGVEISDDGAQVFVACAADEIAVVAVADPAFPVARVPEVAGAVEGANCMHCPYRLAIAPDGTVWVANLGPSSGASGNGEIRVYDPRLSAFDPARTVRACGRITAVEVLATSAGDRAYAVEQGPCGSSIDVFDAGVAGAPPVAAGALPLSGTDCVAPNDLDLSEDGATGYVVCEGDHVGPGSLLFFDPAALAVIAATPTGVFPLEMTVVPAAGTTP